MTYGDHSQARGPIARRGTLPVLAFVKFGELPGSAAIQIEARPIENVARPTFGDPLLDPFDFRNRGVDCLAGASRPRFDRGKRRLQLRPPFRLAVSLRIDARQFEAQPFGKMIELGKLAAPFVEVPPPRLKNNVQPYSLTDQDLPPPVSGTPCQETLAGQSERTSHARRTNGIFTEETIGYEFHSRSAID